MVTMSLAVQRLSELERRALALVVGSATYETASDRLGIRQTELRDIVYVARRKLLRCC